MLAIILNEHVVGAAVVTFITQGFMWLRAYIRAVYMQKRSDDNASVQTMQVSGEATALAVAVLTERLTATETKLARRDHEVSRLNEQHIRLARHAAVLEIQVALAKPMLAVHNEKLPDIALPDELLQPPSL